MNLLFNLILLKQDKDSEASSSYYTCNSSVGNKTSSSESLKVKLYENNNEPKVKNRWFPKISIFNFICFLNIGLQEIYFR